MKIQKLSENMSNLDKVVQNADINSVTEMPPTMSRAYIDSQEADKATKDIIKPADKVIKEKPFLGANKQPEPKEPEEAKINLDESLFDDDSPLTNPYDGDYSLQEQIFDFLDHSDSLDSAEMTELVSDEFGLSPDEADRYVQDWINNSDAEWHDTVDQEEEDISIDSLKDYVDSIEVEEDEDFDESLNENISNNKPACYNDIVDFYYDWLVNDVPSIQDLSSAIEDYDADWFIGEWTPESQRATLSYARSLANDAIADYPATAQADWSDGTDAEFDESIKSRKSSQILKESTEEDIYDKVYQCIQTVFDQAMDNLEEKIQHEVPEYDTNWYSDEDYDDYNKWENAIADVIETTANIYMKNYKDPAQADWSDETDVEFDESLNEEDKSKLSWDELGTEEAEDVDLWTLVYDTLSKERDLAANKAIKRYVTPQLSLKQRYDPINADSDGNIVIYGETEEEFDPAKEVADFHNLEYQIKESPKNWVMKHPEQKYSFTIIIPEDQLNRKLELRRPDVKRGRPKKTKDE